MPPIGGAPNPMISPDAIRRMLMQGGDPVSMFTGGTSQTSTADTPGAPSASSTLPSVSPAAGAGPPSGLISSSMSGIPPMSSDEFGQAKPDAYKAFMPAAPSPPRFSGPHGTLRRVLADLFAGAAEFGGDINHHPGQGAQILNRWADEDQANQQYNANLPRYEAQAKTQAFNQYQEQQKTGAETAGVQAQTSRTLQEIQNMRVNPPGKLEFLQKFSAALKSGEEDPQQVLNQYLQLAGTVPGVTRAELVQLANTTPEVPPSFKIGTQGIREPIRYHGQTWYGNEPDAPDVIKKAAQTAANVENQVHTNKLQEQAAARSNITMQNDLQTKTHNLETGQKNAKEALDTLTDAQNQQKLIEDLLSGKMNPQNQTAALFKMIGLEQPPGSHRVMPAEIENEAHLGGWSDRLKQFVANAKEGDKFPPELIPDVIASAKILTANKAKGANDQLQSNFETYGYKHPGSGPHGRMDEVNNQNVSAQPNFQKSGPPPGATHTAKGSDGKMHYTNTQGQDLGVVP